MNRKAEESHQGDASLRIIQKWCYGAAIAWTIVTLGIACWFSYEDWQEALTIGIQTGRAALEKDYSYRAWNAGHGGVYVPVTKEAPRNPNLAHIPTRDMTTESGLQLTLVNPAYMTRQVQEQENKRYGLKGHITSLRPIRAENRPDSWEKEALEQLQLGVSEVHGLAKMDDRSYMRVMTPMLTDQFCLKCHAAQGYGVGDQRGGVSVSVPMEGFLDNFRREALFQSLYFLTALLLGYLGLFFFYRTVGGHLRRRQQAEEEILAQEKRFKTFFASVNDAIMVHPLQQEGFASFIEVNAITCSRYGYSREEFLQMTPLDITRDDASGRASALAHRKKLLEGRQLIFEALHIKKSGETFPVEVSANIIKGDAGQQLILSVVRDISERNAAEKELRRQHQTITLNNRIAGIFLSALPETRFAEVLEVILEALDSEFGYFGYIDRSGDLLCPSLQQKVLDQSQLTEKGLLFPRSRWSGTWGDSLLKKKSLLANTKLPMPEGHIPVDSLLAVPILHEATLIGQFVVANKAKGYGEHDQLLLETVAEQTAPILSALLKEARQEESHRELEEQYRQAQKMESVGRLAGGVAHDFNNMLGVILGNAELALREIDETHPLYGELLEIEAAANRSADLTRQLLAFARKQTIAPKLLDLSDTVAGMLKMLQRLMGEDISLAWIPGMAPCIVKIDPGQIDQLLANLCVNARDAIEGVGQVSIETRNISFDKDYCSSHMDFLPGDYVLLVVSDNGCGMDAATQANIFDPFFTTKELEKGTGLGLSTVYGIVKQNGGFINVYSEPGHGTAFKIYLPGHLEKGPDKPEEVVLEPGGEETILLVEDEATLLELTKRMLLGLGYTVLSTEKPEEAITLAEQHPDTIHLLLTDVVMPKMNGLELSRHLEAHYPKLKKCFMSGYTANVIASQGVLHEGVHFLAKPFSRQDLAGTVRRVLDEHKSDQDIP